MSWIADVDKEWELPWESSETDLMGGSSPSIGKLSIYCGAKGDGAFRISLNAWTNGKISAFGSISREDAERLIARLRQILRHKCDGKRSPPGKACSLSGYKEVVE